MANKFFLELPIVTRRYPDSIYQLAKRAQVSPDEIADRDNITATSSVQQSQWRIDLVLQIITCTEDSEDSGQTIVELSGGIFEIVKLSHRKLVSRINNFFEKNGLSPIQIITATAIAESNLHNEPPDQNAD
jgi:hypothetical protein